MSISLRDLWLPVRQKGKIAKSNEKSQTGKQQSYLTDKRIVPIGINLTATLHKNAPRLINKLVRLYSATTNMARPGVGYVANKLNVEPKGRT